MKEFTITQNDEGKRVDAFVRRVAPLLPSSLLQKYIRLKRIKRNGKRCTYSDRLQRGDILQLYISDEFFADAENKKLFLSVSSQLDIVYEDENILLCDKKPGLIVHEDENERIDTLINRIQHHLYLRGEYDPDAENSFAPALCNRIDRNTGGIVIAAKNAATLRVLNQKIKDREIRKLYLCLVHGKPAKASGTLKSHLLKDEAKNMVKVFSKPVEGAKTAVTSYRVLGFDGKHSLLEAELFTGRTHQIRAQLASIGHPLVGDAKYGRKDGGAPGMKSQALYSYKLIFSFTTDAEHLNDLKDKAFSVKDVPFAKDFAK